MRNLGSSIRRVAKNARVIAAAAPPIMNMKEMTNYLAKKEREYKAAAEADAWKKYQSEWRKYEEKLAEEQQRKEKEYNRSAEEASTKKYQEKLAEEQRRMKANNCNSSKSIEMGIIDGVGGLLGGGCILIWSVLILKYGIFR